jgi:hypothetical protein
LPSRRGHHGGRRSDRPQAAPGAARGPRRVARALLREPGARVVATLDARCSGSQRPRAAALLLGSQRARDGAALVVDNATATSWPAPPADSTAREVDGVRARQAVRPRPSSTASRSSAGS